MVAQFQKKKSVSSLRIGDLIASIWISVVNYCSKTLIATLIYCKKNLVSIPSIVILRPNNMDEADMPLYSAPLVFEPGFHFS